MSVQIPRDFKGLLTLDTRNNIVMSAELSEHVTIFSEVDNVRRCFIGDLSNWGESGVWTGDGITAETQKLGEDRGATRGGKEGRGDNEGPVAPSRERGSSMLTKASVPTHGVNGKRRRKDPHRDHLYVQLNLLG
jgi:hypothetical protein